MMSNVQLNTMLALSSDVFCIFDRQLQFAEVAGAGGMPWGYDPASLSGKPLGSLIKRITNPAGADVQHVFEQSASTLAPVKFACHFLANHHKIISVEWTLKWQPEHQAFYGVASTIGESPVDGAGNSLHDQMGRIIESITDGLCTVNESWTITGWNKAAEEMTGKKRSELIGKNIFDVFSRELTPAIRDVYQKAMTEKKTAELLVKRSEKKYRNLFNSSPLPMWVYDMETYKFLSVNNAAIRHYGYTREEFLSMTLKDIRPVSEIGRLEAEVNKIRGTERFNEGIFKHCTKSGEVINVKIQGNVIDFDGQEARLVLAIDVSAHLAYMNAIEEQNARLREIAWIQSHVVRAPLARIMALIDVLKDKDLSREDFLKYIGFLSVSGNELDNVIKGIVERTQRLKMP
ncbi:PAS domain-containing protein [Chitinophaga sp. GbtcB8]|uniref:PAS domain-containing protein n=1 Tax=Chitinophaga sp. GbtcB8 TaxID=2824753 RepID=UPI001C2F1DFD|nr:PAS domain S-box protein [Chitinophaga sp. GbtcB8]